MRLATRCALTLAVLSSAACHTTQSITLDMAPASNPVWVTLSDQSVVVLYAPKIYGNKLVGFVEGKYEEYLTAQVKEVHARRLAGARTAALVTAGVVGFAGFAWVLAGAGKTSAPDYCDAPEHVDEPICQGL